MTAHAYEELVEDDLNLNDLEAAVLFGDLVKTETDEPRGERYTVHGTGVGGNPPVGVVGRFTNTGRYLIITVYEVTEPHE